MKKKELVSVSIPPSSVQAKVYINTFAVADEKTTDTTACALHTTAMRGRSFTPFSNCSSQIRHYCFSSSFDTLLYSIYLGAC